jgi:hypothetical protein
VPPRAKRLWKDDDATLRRRHRASGGPAQRDRALCRSDAAPNIPARYCSGYLGDIGVPPPYGPMDFAGWFEAYLGGRRYTFDTRNNVPRIGRVLMARGRDAIDVAISTTFGPNTLVSFKDCTDEVKAA